jgi:hypothetical protein
MKRKCLGVGGDESFEKWLIVIPDIPSTLGGAIVMKVNSRQGNRLHRSGTRKSLHITAACGLAVVYVD